MSTSSQQSAERGNAAESPSLFDEFERDGFVALRGFLTPDELQEVRENVDRLIKHVAPTMEREHVFYEDRQRPETLKQLQRLHAYDAFFKQLFEQGKFPEIAATLLRDEVIGKNFQYFNKPPGVGQPTPPHQDGYYFMLDPCEAVTMWLALDPADEENGCVRYVVGSHRRGMRPHARTQTLGFSQGITDFPQPADTDAEVALHAEPGDLLVHHAMTIHRADGNRSATRNRRALGLIYYARRAKEDTVAKAAYEARLAEELKAKGKV